MVFFGLIVTVTDPERVLAERVRRACPACGATTPHRLVEVYRQLALFFIPVWRWGRRHYPVCQACGHADRTSSDDAGSGPS